MKITATEIKTFRHARQMSQSRLADLLGVSRRTIQNYETGQMIPKSRDRLLRKIFAEQAGLPLDSPGDAARDGEERLKDKIILLQEEKIRSLEQDGARLDRLIAQLERVIEHLERRARGGEGVGE